MATEDGFVFVSYTHADRARVHRVVEALEDVGFTVWWDQSAEAGMRLLSGVEAKLNEAACVVVVWSEASIESLWVQYEAGEGVQQQKLVPITLDSTTPPGPFRGELSVDLSTWDGATNTPAFDRLVRGIEAHLIPKAEPGPRSHHENPFPQCVELELDLPQTNPDETHTPRWWRHLRCGRALRA